jgi:hypothetical protein
MKGVLTLIGALLVAGSPVVAQPPQDVNALVKRMKEAVEPSRPSTRTLTLTVSNMGQAQKFVAGQARKKLRDGKRMATVLLEPADLLGTAFLVAESKDPTKPTTTWIYIPAIRRVRKLIAIDTYQHFLGTDFTYADLGFVRQYKNYRLLGKEPHAGVTAYKIEEKLPPDQMYYSRVITWIAPSTMLPLESDFYDPAGMLWKREIYDSVSTIDGVPTVLHVQMTDLESNTSTDLNVSQVQYDVPVPDSLFDPQHLPHLADDPVWQVGAKQ